MTKAEEPNGNIVFEISSDPNLAKNFFSKLSDPEFDIPEKDIVRDLKTLRGLRSIKAGRLVSRASSPEDYQSQLNIMSQIQGLQDKAHEIKMDLLGLKTNWEELLEIASNYIHKKYYDEVLSLKNEALRKATFSAALQPLQRGLARIDNLMVMAEETQKHLERTMWNIKEANTLIVEFLKPLKYPTKSSV